MLAIRGVYDGKNFKALASEQIPTISREVPVAIVFLEEFISESTSNQIKIAEKMRSEREKMKPLGFSVKNLVEEGRDR